MTKHPPPPPAPGPPPSNRDKMKDAVHQLLQQKAEEKALTRADVLAEKERVTRRQRVRYVQAAVLFAVLVAAIVIAIPRWRQPFDPPAADAAERDARKALVFAATLVEAYEQRTGRLPGNISQLGIALPGVTFSRAGETNYMVSVRIEGRDISYQKGDDKARFLAGR